MNELGDKAEAGDRVEMPAPTSAPVISAAGIALLAAGLVTHWALSLAGGALLLAGLRHWIAALAPGAGEIEVPIAPAARPALPVTHAPIIERLRPGVAGHRMQLPEKVHPYSAGILGGLVGGVVMGGIAAAYGIVSGKGIWYPVNLLAGMLFPAYQVASVEELSRFDATHLVVGLVLHVVGSAAIGLLFGVLLPMFPRRPILWGGLVAPLLWTGALHSLLGVINPLMNEYVDWPWFLASQIGFGIAAGATVTTREKVSSSRGFPEPDAAA